MPASETWNLLIQAARASESRNPVFSENCLRKALRSAEECHGKESAEAGLCLLELADFLERIGMFSEAESLSQRYQNILCKYARELGLTGNSSRFTH
ncbi:MAG: hypothetical protein K2X27_14395 [Candidatus Obscuribacterales bacterium]|nr:hypothetical protein [Candidatus Obscuribacterales bacterium]